jgi:hypothetical protein
MEKSQLSMKLKALRQKLRQRVPEAVGLKKVTKTSTVNVAFSEQLNDPRLTIGNLIIKFTFLKVGKLSLLLLKKIRERDQL